MAITELRTRGDIDRLAELVGDGTPGRRRQAVRERAGSDPRRDEDTVSIFEQLAAGRRAFVAPALDVPEVPAEELLPAHALRERPAELPEVSEPEIVRHFTTLSTKNFDLDEGFYPLGSCTMKHNPKLNERLGRAAGLRAASPAPGPGYAQGALELMWRLQGALAEVSGLPHVSLQPSAGSQGELAGLLLTRAYHEDAGSSATRSWSRIPRTARTRRRPDGGVTRW